MMLSNKNPPHVIFLDKETKLANPPTVFGDFRKLPFRENCFSLIIFDPPFGINMPPWWTNPSNDRRPGGNSFYGNVKSKRELIKLVYDAAQEFLNYAPRLCLKWAERNVTLWKILPLFKPWKQIYEKKHNPTQGRNAWRARGKHLYWVTFVKS